MKFRTCLDYHLQNQSLNICFATSGCLKFVSLCSNTKEGLDKIRILRCSSSMDCTKHKDMGVVQIELKQTTNDLRQMYALLMAAGLALAI